MSFRGGYQIINLANKPFKIDGTLKYKYDNIWYNATNSNGKLMLLSGLNLEDKVYNDQTVIFIDEGERLVAKMLPVWDTILKEYREWEVIITPDNYIEIKRSVVKYEIVDLALDDTSENAIANKVVTDEFKTLLKLDGSRPMTGELNMFGNLIRGVADPISGADAANKDYVDNITPINHVFSKSSGNNSVYLNIWGKVASLQFTINDNFDSITVIDNNMPDILYKHGISGSSVAIIKGNPPGDTTPSGSFYIEVQKTPNSNQWSFQIGMGGSTVSMESVLYTTILLRLS